MRAPLVERPDRSFPRKQQQNHLQRMMVDAAKLHVAEHQARGRDQRHGRERASGPGKRAAKARSTPKHDAKQDQHIRQPRRNFRAGGLKHNSKRMDKGGDLHVHHARPVHRRAIGRRKPVLAQIKPALPCHPVANLRDAHGVVSVAEATVSPNRRDLRP